MGIKGWLIEKMKTEKKYRIINKNRRGKGNLEGIKEIKRDSSRIYRRIVIAKWHNWKHSNWVSFQFGESQVVVDSGVIEELASEIKKLKGL